MSMKFSLKEIGIVSKTKFNELKKKYQIIMDGILSPKNKESFFSQNQNLLPVYPFPIPAIKNLVLESDTIQTIHSSLKKELFRNGYSLEESKDTDEEITTSQEEVNATREWSRYEMLSFLECINDNNQNLKEVCMELEDDFNTWDDAFMVFLMTYGFDAKGEILTADLNQVIRADPNFIGLVLNDRDMPALTNDNKPLTVCPEHRDNLLTDTDKCPRCGLKTYKAYYFSETDSNRIYYFKNEIVHKSKYHPSKRRGFSPVLSVWQKTRTLLFMDKYVMDLYTGQRPPKAGLFFKTSNMDGLNKAWETAKQRAEENPHLPVIMGIPDTSNGQGFVEFIDFMKNLEELQHTEMRNEYRRQIGAVYGVEPIFQNDTSTSGGLNNEGLQVTVTNRAVEYGQSLYNDFFYPAILKAMGVKGWTLTLNPSEEQDEMAKLMRQSQTLDNGLKAVNLGLSAKYSSKTGEVVIEDGELMKPNSEFGGFNSNDMMSSGEPMKSLKKKK